MEYTIEQDDDWTVITLDGAINFECTDSVKSVFEKVMLEGSLYVRLNLENVPAANSSGIGIILMFYKNLKKRGGTLEVKGISNNLLEMFRLLNIDKILKIEE
jgi:anti-anti-sigma factor